MKLRKILTLATVLALATVAAAQTKISGALQCGKADPQHMIELGDRPNHFFMISQSKCTWTKTFEMAGSESKEEVSTAFNEVTGNNTRGSAFEVGTMANGDKYYVRTRGSYSLKEGAIQSGEGKWRLVGGTGKLKGIKGEGTFKGKGGADGTTTWEIEGEYALPK